MEKAHSWSFHSSHKCSWVPRYYLNCNYYQQLCSLDAIQRRFLWEKCSKVLQCIVADGSKVSILALSTSLNEDVVQAMASVVRVDARQFDLISLCIMYRLKSNHKLVTIQMYHSDDFVPMII